MLFSSLPQIGPGHAALKDYLAYRDNLHGNPERLLPIEGLWAHSVALKLGLELRTAFICPELLKSPDYEKTAAETVARAARSFVLSQKAFEKLSDRDGPSGIASLVKPTNFYTLGETPPADTERVSRRSLEGEAGFAILRNARRIVLMDAVEVPGNIGTMLRSLDGLGDSALVLTNRRVRLTHPKVVKGSLGAIFTVPIVTAELAAALAFLKAERIPLFAADSSSKNTVTDFSSATVPERFALVLGSEKYGIPTEVTAAAPTNIFIPMRGVCDSLNVSIAGSILLYGLTQRAQKS